MPTLPCLVDIHHIGITVRDVEESVRFYSDILGLTLIRRREADADYIARQTGYPGVRLSVASFRAGPESKQSLEIVQYLNHAGSRNDTATNRSGNTHLCFLVHDLEEIYRDLSSRGARFKTAPVRITSGPNEGGQVVYLYDPDDYIIELFQPARVS
jgi:catechol 2,3-dioxygenase-like lactoylglutathione lyase family enzyme